MFQIPTLNSVPTFKYLTFTAVLKVRGFFFHFSGWKSLKEFFWHVDIENQNIFQTLSRILIIIKCMTMYDFVVHPVMQYYMLGCNTHFFNIQGAWSRYLFMSQA